MLAAVIAVAALFVAVAVVSYVTSGERGAKGQGMVERVVRYIPLQSLKIVIVAWQILTQVRTIRLFRVAIARRTSFSMGRCVRCSLAREKGGIRLCFNINICIT